MTGVVKPVGAIDFDGTMNTYAHGFEDPVTDPPITGLLAWLAKVTVEFQLVIFTARASSPDGVAAVTDWLNRNNLELTEFTITDVKPAQAVWFLDDRNIAFAGETYPGVDELLAFHPWWMNDPPKVMTELSGRTAPQLAATLAVMAAFADGAVTDTVTRAAIMEGAELAGLDERLKGESALEGKIRAVMAEKSLTVQDAAADVKDALRFSVVADADRYADVTRNVLARVEQAGATLTRLRNYWQPGANPRYGDGTYVGINAVMTGMNGFPFEVQFHTPQSLDVQAINWSYYRLLRSGDANPVEVESMEETMRANNALVAPPSGVARVGALTAATAAPAAPVARVSVQSLNDVLAAAYKRADELEPRLVAILQPILANAGVSAATAFTTHATEHLTAALGDPYTRYGDLNLTNSITAAAAGWTPPAQNEVVNVEAIVSQLRTMTDPVRQALVQSVMGPAMRFSDPAGSPFKLTILTPQELQGAMYDKYSEQIVNDWDEVSDTAGDVAIDALGEASRAEAGDLWVLEDRETGALVSLANVERVDELNQFVVHNIAAEGGQGAGTTLLKLVADQATDAGFSVGLVSTPEAESYYEKLPGWQRENPDQGDVGLGERFTLPADNTSSFAAGVGGQASQVGVAFDVTNPFTARVLQQTGSQITNIAQTTQLNVMRIIKASHDNGLSIPDTAKAIQQGMTEASFTRATLIARTELAGAVNGGSLAAIQIVNDAVSTDGTDAYRKQWLTADGAMFPRHEDYDGLDEQTVDLNDTFEVGDAALQYPGDPDGPPEEVCNCRCTLLYLDAQGQETGDEQDAG